MKISFFSLASGSSGNCYYLGTPEYGILIDAGIGLRTIRKVLKDRSIDFSRIMAVLVTHDHADHIKTVGCLGERCAIPVYATKLVHEGIGRSRYVEETLVASKREVCKEEAFTIRDFVITPFEVPHDSTDNVGYYIQCFEHRFTFITDVGHVTDTIRKYMQLANHLIVEANYDEEMLRSGSYPDFLKKRVASPTGHLSNREAAELLATHYQPHLKNIWLCHLSRDNNHPELATKTVNERLYQEGIRVGKDVMLIALKRTTPSDIYEFE